MIPEQFKTFFDTYTEAVLVTDDADAPVYMNAPCRELTGFNGGNVAAFPIADISKVKVNYTPANDKKNGRWECSYKRANGNELWFKVSVSPLPVDGKNWKIYTLSYNPAHEQLRETLQLSESRFTSLADETPVMIWMTDHTNLTYYFNKSWLDFTGRKLEEEVGTGWFQGVHPDDTQVFNDIGHLLRNNINYSVEYRLKRHDGQYRYILEIGTPRFLPDGSFGGYMGSCLDITEMKMAQVELAAQTKELQRSNEELEQFAYVASHDLQEPLRMISSYVQLISKRIESGKTEGLGEYMQFAIGGVNRIQALINDLLQYSRVNRKGNPFAPVDLNEVMKIVTAHLMNRISETGAKVTFGEMPIVNGDSFQLIRLLQNLTENAIKFKVPDRTPEVHVFAEDRGDYWKIAVKDNGIGIDDKFYSRIFVIFQRLHAREDYEGTGIGLAVCKKIVERHGGEIWVESKTGEGSTFFFTIKK
ncbi:MAG: PAS domain S-box protein [Chitinophagales bacterium]|nr:PAS domain S-box protein [Chitinophagales bacterium]